LAIPIKGKNALRVLNADIGASKKLNFDAHPIFSNFTFCDFYKTEQLLTSHYAQSN